MLQLGHVTLTTYSWEDMLVEGACVAGPMQAGVDASARSAQADTASGPCPMQNGVSSEVSGAEFYEHSFPKFFGAVMAANDESSALQAIKYKRGSLQLLDQRLLPFRTEYLDVPDVKAAWTQIRDMVVRGAPAIGCTGALAMAVELHALKGAGAAFGSAQEALEFINQTLDFLVTRCVPTGVVARRFRAVRLSGEKLRPALA